MYKFAHFAFATVIATGLTACAGNLRNEEKFNFKVGDIHDRIITFDAEMDIPADFMVGAKDVGQLTTMQVDLPKMDEGKLDGAAFVIFVPQGERNATAYAKARKDADAKLNAIESMLKRYPDRIELARSPADVERIVAAKKHFAVISVVNAYPYGENVAWLAELYDRGLRMVAFNHAGHNQFSDSDRPQEKFNNPPAEHGGLSVLGKQAIAEMNRIGIIVDVSQISSAALLQAVELSKAPVVASHVGVKKIVDNPRNLSDEEMKAIAAKGGVVHIVAFSSYLKDPSKEQQAELKAIEDKYGLKTFTDAFSKLPKDKLPNFQNDMAEYRARWPGATVGDMVESIDYAVKLIGIDHVGVSTDMEHSGGVVGYKTAAEAEGLTRALINRDYKEADIAKIWSGNFLRVWRAVEKHAGK
jgi:membrane dipeptidase